MTVVLVVASAYEARRLKERALKHGKTVVRVIYTSIDVDRYNETDIQNHSIDTEFTAECGDASSRFNEAISAGGDVDEIWISPSANTQLVKSEIVITGTVVVQN